MPHGRPAKRRRLTPPIDDGADSETIKASDLFNRAADWDLEQAYEQRSRGQKAKEATRLPTKTLDGTLKQAQVQEEDRDSDSFLESSGDEKGPDTYTLATPPAEVESKPDIPLKHQILQAKEELARLASLLNEDPEEHAGAFKKLAKVGQDGAPIAVQKLVLATLAAVYRDAIPGYRIRAYKDEDLGNKVSKEVRRTRQYEHALVTGYQNYVRHLSSLAKVRKNSEEESSLRTVAIGCIGSLLLAVPHFNFRTELLTVLTHELAGRQATPEFIKCIQTLESFFDADDDGAPSLEAVSLLTKMMKAKDYKIREEVLNTFFHLRLLSELSPASSNQNSGKKADVSKLHGKRVKKEKWEHRSKKERKLARERKAVEKDMKEADAIVNYEERERMQSDTLKLVFATYFRILKAGVPELMGAVLEGLAKYAHLINQDFFGDILEALKDIVNQAIDLQVVHLDTDRHEWQAPGHRDTDHGQDDTSRLGDGVVDEPGQDVRNMTRESLLATQTAFTLLSSQEVTKSASGLQLDLSFFSSHTYRSLYTLVLDADIELGPKALHLPDPHKSEHNDHRNKVNVSTPVLLLIRVLNSILLTPSQPPPTVSAAAFYKRLLTACLQLPEKSSLAMLNLLTRLADKHGRKVEPLWYSDERKGDGVYRGDSESIEGTNVMSVGSGVWETELLRKHYCPKVREQVQGIDKIISGLAKG
jgi:nucleolar complex protein 3